MGIERFDRIPLLFGSSPVHRLERLSEHLGGAADIWAKREGCDSGLAYSGNAGTHTDTWRDPNGAEIPETGKKLDFPFVGVLGVVDSKISSICIHYDQVGLAAP